MIKAVFALSLMFLPIAASAEVKDAAASGFTIENEVVVDAERSRAWSVAIKQVDRWWSSDHTVSGEASRLSISAKPQGCFCEDLGKNAGVVHMNVSMVFPEVVLRLTGGLGPLGLMGVDGNMTWEFDDVEESDGKTRVTFTYAVGGYRPEGLDGMASAVDAVISEALLRFKAYIETGDAEQASLE